MDPQPTLCENKVPTDKKIRYNKPIRSDFTFSILYSELCEDKDSNMRHNFCSEESWSISANNFHEQLQGVAARHRIDTSDMRWPKSPNSISYRLNIIRTNLRSFGIDIIIRRSTTKEDMQNGFGKNSSIIEIRPVKEYRGEDGGDGGVLLVPLRLKKEREGVLEGGGEDNEKMSTTSTISTNSDLYAEYENKFGTEYYWNKKQHESANKNIRYGQLILRAHLARI